MPMDGLKILLLGSPSTSWQGRPFKLARRQARALLYRLASDLQPVSREHLGFLFWPDSSEAQAKRNLNRLLSYLHNALPDLQMLLLHEETAQLNRDLVWSDAVEFAELCANKEVACGSQAIDLYRAAFLEGFYLPHSPEYDRWLAEQRQRYERLFLSAVARLIRTMIDAGEYRQAIPYAQKYLKIDSLAEEIHGKLIVCYAATGRRDRAQAQYEQLVTTLERELGVQPLPETTASYQASLRGEFPDRRDRPAPSTWSVLPATHTPLLGRQEAWRQLEEVCQEFASGGAILISGEAGIGKSRMLMEFATRDGKLVINGNAYPSTRDLSYLPVIEALQLALPHQWLWQGISPVWLSEISLILPEIREQFPDLPEPINLGPQQAQARLLEGLTQVFLNLADNASPLLLCMDDLHWADQMTLAWLQQLAPRIAHSNLCLLATHRTEKAEELAELRRLFNRTGRFHEIGLEGLPRSAIEEMVAACGASELVDEGVIDRLQQVTGGNPFFILEILSAIREGGRTADPQSLPITRSIQTLVETRLDRLNRVARQVLEASAVLAPRLEVPLIEYTSGRQEFELGDALDELANHHLLQSANGGYRFCHDLLRQAVYQGLNAWRCRLLHKRAAIAFELRYKKELAGEYTQIARHYDRAQMPEQAVNAYHAAAQHAYRIYAYQTAIGYLQRAIELIPASGLDVEDAARLDELLGDCLANSGDFSEARRRYHHALEKFGEAEPLISARLLRKIAAAYGGEYAYDEAISPLERALAILGERPEGASLAWQHCWLDVQLERIWIFYLQARPQKIDEISGQIGPIVEQVGTPQQRIKFITGLNYAIVRKNRYRVSSEIVDSERRALAIAQQTGDAVLISEREFNAGILSLLHGDAAAAVELLSAGLRRAKKIGLHPIELQCLVYGIMAHRIQGDLEVVQQLLPDCLRVARQVNQPNYVGAALAHQGWLHYRARDYAAATESGERALALWDETKTYPFQWMGLWFLLEIALAQGELEPALGYAARLVDPIQQAPPDEVEASLQDALRARGDGRPEVARSKLEAAVAWAREQGFL